jgi:hypothetical protein
MFEPNCNWKSSPFQLQSSWVGLFFQFLQLDLETLVVANMAQVVVAWMVAVLHHCTGSISVDLTGGRYNEEEHG